MKRSLAFKLILAFLLVSVTGIAFVAIFASKTTASKYGFLRFTQVRETNAVTLSEYYQQNGSWDKVENLPLFTNTNRRAGMHGMGMGSGFALTDTTGKVITADMGYQKGEQLSSTALNSAIPIRVNGQVVGLLVGEPGTAGYSLAEVQFLDTVNRTLILAALGAIGVALGLGILLARRLTRPLRELTLATRQVALGNLDLHLPVRSSDELGELAHSFNHMSADLARARDLRRQMTADIAHELRTPLSVILSHSEALCDGILPPVQDSFALLRDESYHLNRLVEDLRVLSLADAEELTLNRSAVQPATLLQHLAASQALKAKIQRIDFVVDAPLDLPEIQADPDRVIQVLTNLLNNALTHTPAGGAVLLSGKFNTEKQTVVFSVQDSGPGIQPDELPHIFERFYRTDKSRQRNNGGTGLGLAIAKLLVVAQQGSIWVESQPGEGAVFYVEFPTPQARNTV